MSFDQISGTALDLDGGTHEARETRMEGLVASGIDVGTAAELSLANLVMDGLTGTAMTVAGSVEAVSALITNSSQGIRLTADGSINLRFSTVYGSVGTGFDNAAGGNVTIHNCILYGNGGGDISAVDCADIYWSDVGTTDCSTVNGNIQADPQIVGAGDYHLSPASPALDTGVPPEFHDGNPCTDLDGNPRLLDFTGDGSAKGDIGVYEHNNPDPSGPGTIASLAWTSDSSMQWDADPSAVEYHVYRGTLATISFSKLGNCADDIDPDRSDTLLEDSSVPAIGEGFFYIITGEDAGGVEGSMGPGTCYERANSTPCP
jgi:hypothetical protein